MVWATPLASLLALAASLTLSEAKALDAYAPPILYPDSHTQWKVGETHNVIWYVNMFLCPVHHSMLSIGMSPNLLPRLPTKSARYIS